MNSNLLNAAKNHIISIATANGISLADEFGSVENFQNFVFSLTIKMVMDIGKVPVDVAFDLVVGDGSFQKLSDDLWDHFNKSTAEVPL